MKWILVRDVRCTVMRVRTLFAGLLVDVLRSDGRQLQWVVRGRASHRTRGRTRRCQFRGRVVRQNRRRARPHPHPQP
jgi:hypothetical protein